MPGITLNRTRRAIGVRRNAFGWRVRAAWGRRRHHVLALGESYRRARATRFALATYGSWLIERLRERLSPQQPIGLIDLAGRIVGGYRKVDGHRLRLILFLVGIVAKRNIRCPQSKHENYRNAKSARHGGTSLS